MRVLVADDDPVTRRVLENLLRNGGYEVVIACDGDEAWRILHSDHSLRLVIMDWMMPGMSGIEIVRKLRSTEQPTYRYVVLVTSRIERESLIEGLAAGVDDYLSKPFDIRELQGRLRAGERILQLEDRLVTACEVARFQADHDGLTDLLNHNAILRILQSETSRSMRDSSIVGALLIDIDHFKQINDTYGHQSGDKVLKSVSEVIQNTVREYDSVGRYGGEELLVVAPQCDLASARRLGERIRAAVAGCLVETAQGSVRATVSVGVTVGRRVSPEDLLRSADIALYCAKKAGRNRVESSVQPGLTRSQSASAALATAPNIIQ